MSFVIAIFKILMTDLSENLVRTDNLSNVEVSLHLKNKARSSNTYNSQNDFIFRASAKQEAPFGQSNKF